MNHWEIDAKASSRKTPPLQEFFLLLSLSSFSFEIDHEEGCRERNIASWANKNLKFKPTWNYLSLLSSVEKEEKEKIFINHIKVDFFA